MDETEKTRFLSDSIYVMLLFILIGCQVSTIDTILLEYQCSLTVYTTTIMSNDLIL